MGVVGFMQRARRTRTTVAFPDDLQHKLDSVAWFAETVIHPMRDLEVSP